MWWFRQGKLLENFLEEVGVTRKISKSRGECTAKNILKIIHMKKTWDRKLVVICGVLDFGLLGNGIATG